VAPQQHPPPEEAAAAAAAAPFRAKPGAPREEGSKATAPTMRVCWNTVMGWLGMPSTDGMPASPPRGWPDNVKAEELEAQPERVVSINGAQRFSFRSNFVKSSRYTLATFLPMFLYESFHPRLKGANFYFLVIAALQTIDEISNTNGYPTMLAPILIIVLVDGVMAVLEDLEKHEADRVANGTLTAVLQEDGSWSDPIPWMDVRVGDIIRVRNREVSPADVMLLAVAEPDPRSKQGLCYVETKSLDGETDLKLRQALEATLEASPRQLRELRGSATLNHPNDNMHEFDVVVDLEERGCFAKTRKVASWDNMLLRGVTVRNTEWVAGIVLNTGDDTKIVMSSKERTYKMSRMEHMVNRQLIVLVALLASVCTVGAFGAVLQNVTAAGNHWYLYPEDVTFDNSTVYVFPTFGTDATGLESDVMRNQGLEFVIMFFYYFLLFSNFIPISLYVSMAVIKSGQAYFMQQDLEMYSPATDRACQVKNMKLNEQLGQVSHIFSDKTGTLTCNVMDFRKCIVGGKQYGRGTTTIGEASAKVQGITIDEADRDANVLGEKAKMPHVSFWDPRIWRDLEGGRSAQEQAQAKRLDRFFRVLSVCHTVTPEKLKDGNVAYSASSPDDEALVCGAKYFGYYFCDRVGGAMVVKVGDRMGKRFADAVVDAEGGAPQPRSDKPLEDLTHPEHYEVLEILEFSSTRKRMSVIVRHRETGAVHVWAKGADSIMKPRLSVWDTRQQKGFAELQTTDRQLQGLAEEGLRTLLVAGKDITEAEFQDWIWDYHRAKGDLEQINRRKRGEPNDIDRLMDEMERGLELYGATAIEDRLQDDVPDTVATLMKAGIKIWVLTGDKEETAINIGRACQLVKKEMEVITINERRVAGAPGTFAEILDEQADDIEEKLEDWHNEEREVLKAQRGGRSPRPVSKHNLSFRISSNKEAPRDVEMIRVMGDGGDAKVGEDNGGDCNDEEAGTGGYAYGVGPSPTQRFLKLGSLFQNLKPTFALVVDGMSLSRGLKDQEDRDKLLRLALLCDAVICCRVSPKQKKEIVNMVCEADEDVLSLAIGDGANDVAMIKAAHVGVGVSGQEGMQAVNNSDFAISEFRFLRRLLMVQGRYNYRRTAKAVLYIFYKNLIFTMTNFWMSFWTLNSGQKFLIEASVQLYNVMFTALPVLLMGIWDRDVRDTSAMKIPALYTPCIHNVHFNLFNFWRWIGEAVVQSLIIAYVPMWFIEAGDGDDGNVMTLWEYGSAIVTLVVWTVNLKLFMIQNRWTWWQLLVWLLTIGTWFLTGFVYELLSYQANPITVWTGDDGNFVGVFSRLMGDPNFWLVFVLVTWLIWARDFVWKAKSRMWSPSVYMVVQEIDAGFGEGHRSVHENFASIHYHLSRVHHMLTWQHAQVKKEQHLERQLSRMLSNSNPPAQTSPGNLHHILGLTLT